MRLRRVLLICLALPLALWVTLPLVSSADPQGRISSIQGKIQSKQGKLDKVNGKARVLTSDISALTARIDALQGTISTLQGREDAIQSDLDAKRRELSRTQTQLRAVRARLVRLRARFAHARTVLAQRLVEIYKADEPDVISVVLDSHGFADLLENGAYLRRIGEQDREIITAVRDAKEAMAGAARRLGELERHQQQVAQQIYEQRNAVARVRLTVQGKRDSVDRVRGSKRQLLHSVHAQAGKLDEDIAALQAQQSKIQSEIQAAQGGGSIAPGPIRGGGRFIWPVNGPITSPFCERRAWEACHPGIDIGVPSGTPIRAAGTGTVVIAGWVSGYGNYTCIDHGGGLSTCYGHQSVLRVSVGQHVTQGQIIGLSGCTGLCFGPHLHFEVRINGAVTNPVNYLG
ncbi:MAG TPA: peptidoglycan DD-metalloendopeptidase family protein [Conexibacter sp.]|nr:peptidoglycan DD-metalloendopeptidase family protein [Conexibacter sp.]